MVPLTGMTVQWCSGYHARFTRERSRVRPPVEPVRWFLLRIPKMSEHCSFKISSTDINWISVWYEGSIKATKSINCNTVSNVTYNLFDFISYGVQMVGEKKTTLKETVIWTTNALALTVCFADAEHTGPFLRILVLWIKRASDGHGQYLGWWQFRDATPRAIGTFPPSVYQKPN